MQQLVEDTTPAALDPESVERLRAAVGRLSRRLRDVPSGASLTPSQLSVLFTVARRGPLGISELAELEAINPTMLSRIVAQLCHDGLLVREARDDDRRAATVSATARGRRLRERVHRERARALGELIATLDGEQRAALEAALPALEELAARVGDGRR